MKEMGEWNIVELEVLNLYIKTPHPIRLSKGPFPFRRERARGNYTPDKIINIFNS